MCISCIVVNLLGTLGVRVAGHVTASGPLGTCLQIIIGENFVSNFGDLSSNHFRGEFFPILGNCLLHSSKLRSSNYWGDPKQATNMSLGLYPDLSYDTRLYIFKEPG